MKHHVAMVLALACATTSPVSAFARPSPEWAQHADTLARVLVAEADGSRADWSAMLWVLEHRREQSGALASQVLRYSRTLQSTTQRTRRIHELPRSELSSARARQLADAIDHVHAWIAGGVPDPCPGADHWRGLTDSEPDWFSPVSCGPTRQIFGTAR